MTLENTHQRGGWGEENAGGKSGGWRFRVVRPTGLRVFFSSLSPANCVFFCRCSVCSRPVIACYWRFCLSLFDPAIAGAPGRSLHLVNVSLACVVACLLPGETYEIREAMEKRDACLAKETRAGKAMVGVSALYKPQFLRVFFLPLAASPLVSVAVCLLPGELCAKPVHRQACAAKRTLAGCGWRLRVVYPFQSRNRLGSAADFRWKFPPG